MKIYSKCVDEAVDSIELKDYQKGALISFIYNLGTVNFESSALLKLILENSENYDEITKQFFRWNKAG